MSSPLVAETPYRQAAALYEQGRFADAERILINLLAADPSDVEARHALAMCQLHTDQYGAAIANFHRLVEIDPTRYDDAYRLGVVLQHQGAHQQAAIAFRQVLAVSEHRDTRERLQACELACQVVSRAEANVSSEVMVPGPASVRAIVDQYSTTERGRLVRTTTQRTRHLLPALTRVLAQAVAISLLRLVVPIIFGLLPVNVRAKITDLPPEVWIALQRAILLLVVLAWLRAAALAISLVVRSRLYTVIFFERGLDIATGVFHRSKQFIWYYQITEEPCYLRGPWMFVTHTASLRLKYNDAATSSQDIDLSGIGSPQEVDWLRSYIQARRLAERSPMRGFLT